MKIVFADFSGWDFDVRSVETSPLGGSQSAACYLARVLAALGHDVSFLTSTSTPGTHYGVRGLSWAMTPVDALGPMAFDVFVGILASGNGRLLREKLADKTRLLLWTQHRCDQPGVQALANAAERESYDGFAFVSDWQRAEFLTRFGIPAKRARVLRNGVTPAFLNLFASDEAISPAKAEPPVLAYTSTPFRGLDLLLESFPAIRAAIPGTRLRVFSSMQVYRTAPIFDHLEYGALYQRCRVTPGIEYVGSLPQPVLAREMRGVTMLAYPNTFPETSCIAVLEALASGCRIVTSDLGALPETTAGFAELILFGEGREAFLQSFVERTIDVLRGAAKDDEVALRQRVDYIRETATWEIRAAEWVKWLESIR